MLCSAAPLLRRGRSHAELHLKREKRELHCAGANRAEPPRFASARKSRWGLAEFGARRFAKRTLRHMALPLQSDDVGRRNHLAPFLGFVGDEFAEISGRACKHRAAQIGKPCFEFWICNADIDFLVQSFDELCGRALRSTNSEPCTCLVV